MNKSVIIKKDGNMWCAHRDDFLNLQESVAEFGKNESEALHNLLNAEMDIGRNKMLKNRTDHDGQSAEEWRKREARVKEALKGLI